MTITEAYFLVAVNIADADLLADVAAVWGFSRDEARAITLHAIQLRRVEQETADSVTAGVRSVPHFIFLNRLAVNGGRSEEEIAAAISSVLHPYR
ncbi:hypothetical protein [Pantoea sp. Morm]|uniref:DsbA family oxidoreductase n=1 Tax=Pantoea sp. Morm TaxID=2601250 RepID=UPI0031FDE71A